mgnify:CR=1 FL=1
MKKDYYEPGIYIEQVFINFSRRSVKIVDSDGYDDTIEWEWTKTGADGFLETVTNIQNDVPSEIVTYCFSEKEGLGLSFLDTLGIIGILSSEPFSYAILRILLIIIKCLDLEDADNPLSLLSSNTVKVIRFVGVAWLLPCPFGVPGHAIMES